MFGETEARNNYEIVSTRRRRRTIGTCSEKEKKKTTRRRRRTIGTCSEKEKKKTTRGCRVMQLCHTNQSSSRLLLVTRPPTKSRRDLME
ncbi:hypothetical protein RHMOL_Rhmol07G0233100 [Rhododendron molle]|uniref:Uncharacterized protein n=1 Tax=Rhododendron molle TaxID=49168 RepID=A0ACC0N4W9_RHOML|nr:hypothetical protein RHMOL_Rhmol07G0233100 [Rhododendron molle]